MLARTLLLSGLLIAISLAVPTSAQDKSDKAERPPFPKAGVGPTKAGDLKKYDDVITKEAKTYPGVFIVHRIDDKVFFEIPKEAFDKLMLWQAEVVKGPAGLGRGGRTLGKNYVRWERRNNKVYLWQVSFTKRTDNAASKTAVDASNMDAIIASFNVEAEGKDRTTVINVTSLYLSDNAELSVKAAAGSQTATIDESRSYLEEVKSFPTNIEVRSLLTFRGGSAGVQGLGKGPPGGAAQAAGPGRSVTTLVHYSLVMLPEKPMMGRLFDPRVGYFVESFENYTEQSKWMQRNQYIARYRLEKKDPAAEISEPIKPIIFYVSREVPEKWRPYMIKGIEDWKVAFEKAGFKNAIIGKEAPDPKQDPTWDQEDARYSVIRWVAEPVANAMGPHVHDPRSGETISSHIMFWHDILKLTQEWYFVQCSAQDERARKLPLPDELIGDLMRYVTAHEVGHTLGLRHNHRGSSAYTIEQLRDPKFTETHGTVGSIMAYGRFNYVAQPEDKVKQLIPVVGPYDIFAIDWGYRPIPGAKTPEAEKPTLDKWAARQIEEPWLRFGGEDGAAQVDPTVKTENISSDSLKATELGFKNLDRVLDHLIAGTTAQGEDFSLLEEMYDAIMLHRRNWLNAVALNVGGVVEQRTLGGRGTETFQRVPKARQKEAVDFLIKNAFTTPTKLLNPAIVNHFKYTDVAGEITSQQAAILRSLLAPNRIRRLMDSEVLLGDKAYTAIDLLTDVQNGLWTELDGMAAIKIDPLRRNLQRTYLENLRSEIAPKVEAASQPASPFGVGAADTSSGDFKAIARDALKSLKTKIDAAIPKAGDTITRVHLQEASHEIEGLLTDKK